MNNTQQHRSALIKHIANSIIVPEAANTMILVKAGYTEGIYGDTPQNRKLNRVGKRYSDSTKITVDVKTTITKILENGSYVLLNNGEKGKVIRYASKDDIQVVTKEGKILKTSKDQIDSIIDKIEGIPDTKPQESMVGSDGITINVGDKIEFVGFDKKMDTGIAKYIDKEHIYGWSDKYRRQLKPGIHHVVKI